jgi:tRNA modification GTPase
VSGRETIFALSTARGAAAIAVIRVSGPAAGPALAALVGRPAPPPRRATRVTFRDPATGEALDDGLALWFPAPRSSTGEDLAELHLHGGRAVIEGVLAALAAIPGLRPAEPGEFTKRAFLNGKLDLTAAEGLGDLIAADTAAQRRQALRQMEGGLAALYDDWRARLIQALAWIEAEIDFPEEGLPADLAAKLRPELAALSAAIRAHLDDRRQGEVLRDGLSVAILGAPNVGKSSLLNALTRRDTAIVSAIAGTTRDIVEARIDLAGFPIILADTAGLRGVDLNSGGDPIEREGVRRARARAEHADLKLLIFDARVGPDAETRRLADADACLIANKIDLAAAKTWAGEVQAIAVSALTGEGIDHLRAALLEEARTRMSGREAPVITRARHRLALEEVAAALDRALVASAPELLAEDVRLATRALGRITGRVEVEDLLDIIFRDFCIGK